MGQDMTDAELVARCLEAKEAFTDLYRRHAPAVFSFLKGMHRGDEHAAADSLQETFFRAYNALGRFDPERPLRPWLFTIAANVAKDALEKTKRAAARDPDDMGDLAGSDSEPIEKVARRDSCFQLLERARDRLPVRTLTAFLLAKGQGLELSEIAVLQGCSIATVKRDVSDALATLAGVATELGLV
jgi:RNA polymerase sigma-70 factor (ECF subfamily)